MIVVLLDITNEHLTFLNEHFYRATQKYLFFSVIPWYFLGVFNQCHYQQYSDH